MHLLSATPGTISDGEEAIELDQPPGDIVILTVADSESWPAWKPTAEFNAIRDRTADQRR